MTEKEAKGKWCPLARIGRTTENTHNRYPNSTAEEVGIPDTCKCLASICMLWSVSSFHKNEGYCGLQNS